MNSRDRFLAAVNCQTLDRPPVWVMRQAGRYLLRRYELDAAILFSDILVIPEAMGQPYHFRDGGGIGMDFIIENEAQVDALDEKDTAEKLSYMGAALRSIRGVIGEEKALLGFGGSPWTLAAYMTEGGSLKNCSSLKHMFYEDRALFEKLMEKISTASSELELNASVLTGLLTYQASVTHYLQTLPYRVTSTHQSSMELLQE